MNVKEKLIRIRETVVSANPPENTNGILWIKYSEGADNPFSFYLHDGIEWNPVAITATGGAELSQSQIEAIRKASKLVIDGDGINYLSDDGTYKPFPRINVDVPTRLSQLVNDCGFITGESIPTKTSQLSNDSGFLTEHQKIKTINGNSLIGEGNITIEGDSGESVTVDSALSDSSTNPVQNKIVKKAIDSKQDKGDYALKSDIPDISGKADKTEIPDITGLAKKTDIPDVSNLATKAEVSLVDTKADANAADILKKVDKVDGKGLSTNDYTDADKTKVGKALTEHQSLDDYYTKEEVDNKVAQGGTFDPTAYYNRHDVDSLVGGKVDKVEGKSLSSNDYTDEDKAKVASALTEHQDISGKQDVIADLDTIRSGAAKGATALQSFTESDPLYTKDKPNLALKSEIPNISGLVKTADFSEANLGWGGRNLSNDFSPVDAAMIPRLGANRFAFLPASCWTVEYSRDGGETWIDYEATDEQKLSLTSVGTELTIGKSSVDNPSTGDCLLRLTLNPIDSVYTIINKFAFYITTSNSEKCYCTIEGKTKANLDANSDTWDTFANSVTIAGWSGWNIINYPPGIILYNNYDKQYARIRFIFGCGSSKDVGLTIRNIYALGGVGWIVPSNMARQGTIYSYDCLQTVTFPNEIVAKNIHGRKSDGTTHQVAYIDDSRFTDARPASDVSAWAKAATKPTYTPDEIGAYAKPSGGIPKADLASAVQTSLGKADTALQSVPNTYRTAAAQDAIDSGKVDKVAGKGLSTNDYTDADKAKVASALQSYTETDPTVPAWAKQSTKPSYTAAEVGALPSTTKIPSKTSDLSNDSGFLTQHQKIKTINGNSLVGEGDITIEGGGGGYDISAIVAKASESDWTSITKDEFDAVVEAAVANKTIWSIQTDTDKYGTYTLYRQYISTVDKEDETYRGVTLYSSEGNTYVYIRLYFSDESGYQIIALSKDMPSKTSDLTNDSGFITSSALSDYAKASEVDAKIAAIPSSEKSVYKLREIYIGFGNTYFNGVNYIVLSSTQFVIIGRSTGLNIALPDGSDEDGKEYICQFYVGDNGSEFTLTLPNSVIWLNGEAPTIESNACYTLSIVNHCAVMGMFKQLS